MTAPEQSGTARTSNRARGRELALWILCHLESHAGAERDAVELFFREPPTIDPGDAFLEPGADELAALLADGNARRFARRLVENYLDHATELDADIQRASARWRMARMDRVDRNLLRMAAVEVGVGWIPHLLEMTDDRWWRNRIWAGTKLKKVPSEYFRDHWLATFIVDRSGVAVRHLVGVENMAWSTDFPHHGNDWPYSRKTIDTLFADVPTEERRKIVCENAARFWGLAPEKWVGAAN